MKKKKRMNDESLGDKVSSFITLRYLIEMIKSHLEVEWDTCGSREVARKLKEQNGELKHETLEDLQKVIKEMTTVGSVMDLKEKDDISSAEKERKSKKGLDWKTVVPPAEPISMLAGLKPIDDLINTTFTDVPEEL